MTFSTIDDNPPPLDTVLLWGGVVCQISRVSACKSFVVTRLRSDLIVVVNI